MAKAKIATTDMIAKKWANVTPGRSGDYKEGVLAPKADWEAGTVAAAANFKAAVSAGNIDAKFKGGVKRAGTAKWQKKASTLGADRFGPGVSAATADYSAGFDPYRAVIEGVDLSDRKPRGDPSNITRVSQMSSALAAKRVALKVAGS